MIDISSTASDEDLDLNEEAQKSVKADTSTRLTRNRDNTDDKHLLGVTYAQKCIHAAVCINDAFPDPEQTLKMLRDCMQEAEDHYNFQINLGNSYDRLACVSG